MSDSRWFSRHRLAWVILTGSFISCILLTITVPLGISAFVQKAARLLEITVQANQGTVGIEEENGPRRAVLITPQVLGGKVPQCDIFEAPSAQVPVEPRRVKVVGDEEVGSAVAVEVAPCRAVGHADLRRQPGRKSDVFEQLHIDLTRGA